MVYYKRHIDSRLQEWKKSSNRKPLLIRGARQVGKSSAVRELGRTFKYFVEINLEKQPTLCKLFTEDIDVRKTCVNLSASVSVPIIPGETLLFIDEIQVCQSAMMALRYFKEDYPELHVIAAGSLLEFTLEELPSFAVGRIRSLYLYPFSFDEFLGAQGLELQVGFKTNAVKSGEPLVESVHTNLVEQLRSYYLVGGMPAAVSEWVEKRSFLECSHVHRDILDTYQDDFTKYKKRISPVLLRQVLRSVALQSATKFVYSQAANDAHSVQIKECLHLLTLAGLITPVKHSDGNGVPLGAEENNRYIKYLFMDIGLMQTMLDVPATDILLASDVDFVNKGAASEVFAGLEMMKYADCFQKADMYYWQHMSRNGNAEVDYLTVQRGKVIPLEVKANTQGSMQSMNFFMDKKSSAYGIRTSLENVSHYLSKGHPVYVCPLYALSALPFCGDGQ